MSENSAGAVSAYAYTLNRELSWLRFNRRVLEEAAAPEVPLLERLRFLAIFSSNLDEFFMIRVGDLFDLSMMSPDEIDNKSGMTPGQQLSSVYLAIPELVARKAELYAGITAQLEPYGIRDLGNVPLEAQEQAYMEQYFLSRILPILSPQVVDPHHPFPHLTSKALYVASQLEDAQGGRTLGLIPVPEVLPKILCMPDSPARFLRMEDVIQRKVSSLFGTYHVVQTCVLCVTRNADLSYDEEKFEDDEEDFRNRMSKLLKKRARLSIVRLELCGDVDEAFLGLLKNRIAVEDHQIYFDSTPLDMRYVDTLIRSIPAEQIGPLLFPPYAPRWPEDLAPGESIMEQIRRQDRLLFFPFDRVDPFLRLLGEAAERPDVLSIKITIYRLATSSKIARILCRAAENGKEVTVLMELRARFDEANNISWSRLLEDAGCRVIYGVENFKCHSKICLVTLRDGDRLRYITQIGTGNYNEKTNAMYTDLSLMTASETIGADATAFFQNMMVGNLAGSYHRLLVAPSGMKTALLTLIDREIRKGTEGYLCIKANALTERELIDKLSEASGAGVEIHLILRGICCLRPGIPGHTERIQVTSIVGRYLEHARIYCFGKGTDATLLIASSDLMTRNLNRRVEIACPVEDASLKEMLLTILRIQLSDRVKASVMKADGCYERLHDAGSALDSQAYFMEHSLHKKLEPQPHAQPDVPGCIQRFLRRLHGKIRNAD